MKRSTPLARPGLTGSLGALLLAALLFFGALDRAPATPSRLSLDATGDVLCPQAAPAGHPLRFEHTTLAKRHRSPFRLQHLRAKTANLCGAVSVAPLVLRSALPSAPDLATARAGHRTTAARAPPSA
jgi:hypothetical protein